MNELMQVIDEHIAEARYGIFFSRNLFGDTMENIFDNGKIKVDICRYHGYFEVFGLTESQQMVIEEYYERLLNSRIWRANNEN